MKKILFVVLFSLAVFSGPVAAQEEPKLEDLEIAIWPEYDRPDVLVIYRGTLPEGTLLPAPVEIRIPARVGQPTAVAYVGEGGQRFNQEYTTRQENGWLAVEFDLDAQGFQLEYYDTLSAGAQGEREYAFKHISDYDTRALSIEFQVPPMAQQFALSPEAGSVFQGNDGLTYHLADMGASDAGEEYGWTLSYLNPNSDLTSGAGSVEQAPAAPAAVAQEQGNSTVWIFLVAFVALLAVGAGAFWLGSRAQPPPPAPRPAKRRGSGRGPDPAPPLASLGDEEGQFCHRCGARLRLDAEFCHKCGSQVRAA